MTFLSSTPIYIDGFPVHHITPYLNLGPMTMSWFMHEIFLNYDKTHDDFNLDDYYHEISIMIPLSIIFNLIVWLPIAWFINNRYENHQKGKKRCDNN